MPPKVILLSYIRRLRQLYPDTNIHYEVMQGKIWFDEVQIAGSWDIHGNDDTEEIMSDGLWESLLQAVTVSRSEKKDESTNNRRKRIHRKKSNPAV